MQETGDWEGWLRYFLRGVAEVGTHSLETASRVLELRERDRDRVVAAFGNGSGNALRVLEALFHTPLVSVADVRGLTGLTMAPANRMVARMVEMGILVEITGQRRNRYFQYLPYVRLFGEDPLPPD